MFAVFHKHPGGRLEWIGGAETDERARLMARMWSRYGNTEVVVIENGDNGRTRHRATFFQGQLQNPEGESHPMAGSNPARAYPSEEQKH